MSTCSWGEFYVDEFWDLSRGAMAENGHVSYECENKKEESSHLTKQFCASIMSIRSISIDFRTAVLARYVQVSKLIISRLGLSS